MSANSMLFQKSLLAEASYANFINPVTGIVYESENDIRDAFAVIGRSSKFASELVAGWRVVDQFTAPSNALGFGGTGFSATLFQSKASGQYAFAVRGTEFGFADLVADFSDIVLDGVAMDQVVDMYNYWKQLTTPNRESYTAAKLETDLSQTAQFAVYRAQRLLPGGQAAYDAYVASLASAGAILDTNLSGVVRVRYLVTGISSVLLADTDLVIGKGKLIETGMLDVVGHSLGGHLAAAFTRLFPQVSSQAVTINGAGFPTGLTPGLSGYALSNIQNLFTGLNGSPTFDATAIYNIHGSGVNFVTMNSQYGLVQPGSTQEVYIEEQTSSTKFGHAVSQLTDSLAVYDLFAQLDAQLRTASQATLNGALKPIFEALSANAPGSLEQAVNALVKLFGLSASYLSLANGEDREGLFQRIAALRPAIQDFSASFPNTQLISLVNTPSSSLQNLAIDGDVDALAYRYTLRELNPFVVLGAPILYQALNQNGNLDLYTSQDTTPAGMTTQYLADRAQMLAFLGTANTNDAIALASNQVNDQRLYVDMARKSDGKPIALNVFLVGGTANPSGPNTRIFGFGTYSTDVMRGRSNNDRLYGEVGTDALIGAAGDDYLEGGTGVDAYMFSSADGEDTILDTDGKGELVRNGKALALGVKQSDEVWILGGTTYTKNGADLVVTFADNATDKVTLTNFDFAAAQSGAYMGIRLVNLAADPAATNPIYGDLEPIDFDPPNHDYHTDALGNLIVNPDSPAPDRVDTLLDSTGSDLIDAGGGDDLIAATRGGGDWVIAGAGRDRIQTAGGDDIIEGGAGDDIAQGGAGNDRIYGRDKVALDAAIAAGETASSFAVPGELLSGDGGDDVVIGAGSRDLLLGGDGKDVIVGGGGDDTVYGDASLIAADLTWTATRSMGEGATYSVLFANGSITSSDIIGAADAIYGGSGDDWVFAGAGDDFVDGGAGLNVLFGEAGSDVLVGGADNDVLVGDSATIDALGLSGDDYLDGGAGADQLFGGKGNDILIGAEGLDNLSGGDGDDYLDGGADADLLFGGIGNDNLAGGAGNDQLYGGDGNDVLDGGVGQDVLRGEGGKDTYVFNAGDVVGNEFVDDLIDTANSAEASVLVLNGYTRNQIKFRTGSLMVDLGDGGAIHFEGFAPSDPNSTPLLDSIVFGDGTSMSYLDVLAQGFDLDGTEEDEFLFGTAVTDRIDGKGGDDVIASGSGDDVLTGGTGDDQLFGQEGRDTYVFNRGDGADLVNDMAVESGAADASVLQLGAGIARADLTFRLDAARNLLVDTGQGDTVAFGGFSTANPASTPVLASIEFADASSMSYAELLAQGFDFEGSADDDVIHGTGVTDRVVAGDGNDYARTEAGDDVLDGGDGDDALDAGSGDDLLVGGAGADTLYGGEGNDILIGGAGSNSLQGDAGDDDIFAGDGDTVIDTQGNNRLDLTAYTALTASNLEITQFQADGGDLYLNLHTRNAAHPGQTPATGGVSLVGGLDSFATVTLNDGAGGTVTLAGSTLGSYVRGGLVVSGTAGPDSIAGTGGDDTIKALAGSDTVDAGAGNDRLDGGSGDDTLSGGAGNDTYLLALNGGRDTVIEDGEAGSTNTIQLDGGITAGMLEATRMGEDLRIQVKATGDALVVKDFYARPQVWQEGWQVLDAQGRSAGIADLAQGVVLGADEWLAAQKESFVEHRAQVFGAGRVAEGLAPIGGDEYQRVDRGFSAAAQRATSTTLTATLTEPNVLTAQGAGQTIDATFAPERLTYVTQAVQLVSQSVTQSTGAGRSAAQSSFGIGTSGKPNPYFVPAGGAFSVQQGAGITVTPVYGPYTGIPPRNAQGQIDPTAMELKGWWIYNGPAPTGSSSPLAQRLIQNVVQWVAIDTKVETKVTVADVAVSGSALSRAIDAQNSAVQAGAGDDSITLGTSDFFRLPGWVANVALDSLIDPHSPSAAQWRYRDLARPAGDAPAFRYGSMTNPGLRTLGAYADAGAGADEVVGGAGDDTIAGGDGDDYLDGGYGADTYLYAADETGIDSLADYGYVDAEAFGDWYYWNRGILNWDERLDYGGMYRAGGNEFNEGVSYWATPEEAYEEFYPGMPLDYIEPLSDLPPEYLTTDDTAIIEALTDAGVLARDAVRFGPGLSFSDLELSLAVDLDVLEDYPDQPWYYGGTLSVRWGDAGFDTNFTGVWLDDPLDTEDSLLGEGIEAFDFADGSSYSLAQFLNAAKLLISGTPYDDELSAGARDERLQGGSGGDTYLFDAGFGADTVADDDGGQAGEDVVQFGEGIAPADVSLSRQGANLVAHVAGSADELTVKGQFTDAGAIEQFVFADGTTWYGEDIYDNFLDANHAPELAQAPSDQVALVATPFSASLPAGAFVDADAGETLRYSATLANGDDLPAWLSVSPVSGRLYGTPGEDDAGALDLRISATDPFGESAAAFLAVNVLNLILGDEDSVNYLAGTDEADYIVGGRDYDAIYGNGGNDWIVGGAGEYDDLVGGEGDDTYLYNRGDGVDGIYDEAGEDTVRFGAGIAPADVLVTRDPWGTLYLEVDNADSRLELYEWFAEESKIEHVAFANGTRWDAAEMEARIVTAPATARNDILNLSEGNDVADGLEGNDAIYGNGGNDALFGGAGDDSLQSGAGANLLAGGAGTDYLFNTGGTASLALFNAGDGEDQFQAGDAAVLSLAGVALADIALETDGQYTLRIGMGSGGGVTLFNYGGGPLLGAGGKLQIVGEDIRAYDLSAVVQAFFEARAQNPAITQWSAAAALQDNLLSVSTTEAYGGALAYQYATTGGVNGLSAAQRQTVIGSADFGVAPQPIAPPNQAPTGLELFGSTVLENAPNAAVGTLSTTDADAGDTFAYSILDGGDGAQFAIVGDELRVGAAGLDYEAGATRTVTIRTTDAAGAHFDRSFSIQVTDVAEGGNTAPVVSAADATLLLNDSLPASSLFSVSDANGDAIAQYEFWDSTAGGGRFEINGVEQAVNVAIPVSGSQLAEVTFAASESIGSDLVWVRANDGQAWSDWKSWNVYSAPHLTNALPVIAAANGELLVGTSVGAASLFTATDADSDAITRYEFWDDVAGGGYFALDGVPQTGNPIPVAASQLAGLDYVAGGAPGTEQVWVRASDGIGWGAWKAWNMTSALHVPNAAPEVAAQATQTVLLNASVPASSLFTATDADQDAITQYEFWDSTAGGGHFAIGGAEQGVNVSIPVSASALSEVTFEGSQQSGTDLVWVRASDGQVWGDWKSWSMQSSPHATNAAPVVSAADATLLTGQVATASSLFSVSDADGDPIAQYQFWDDVSGGGYWQVNGVQQAAGQNIDVTAGDLANTQYVGGAGGGTERVWVRAYDGIDWGAWKPWNLTTALHVPNAAPEVAPSAATQTVLLGQAVSASGLFSVTDADNDAITQYEFWDSTAGGGHFAIGGAEQAVNAAIPVSASQLPEVAFQGSQASGSDLVWVRANDGQVWSDWKSWTMQSSPHLTNALPVASAPNAGFARGETVAAGTLFSVADADNDAITGYQFWDDVNGGGYWRVNGVQQAAAQAIGVSAADLANTAYVGGANSGTEQVWVRASDGIGWGPWRNWLLSTEGGMLRGGSGPDVLNGDAGSPVLEGGGGDDTLNAGDTGTVLSGNSGADALNGAQGSDFFVGGSGDDTIHTGAGQNVIAFNRGDGADQVFGDAGAENTVSLGNGIRYGDLSLAKEGNDLVLSTGNDENLTFKDWYAGRDDVLNLQLILDATSDFDAGSQDPLLNRKVQNFDFRGMVAQFDQARAESPGLTSWALTNALLAFHLSGADGEALGGDLAYWYGRNGALTGMGLAAAQAAIGVPGFGSDAHSLHAFNGLQEGLVKLS